MIPVIDFAAARSGDSASAAAAAIREACETSGFFYITNRGVPEAVTETALAQARRFLHQPPEANKKVAINAHHRGFNALGDALTYEAQHSDYKEFYSIGLEFPENNPDVLAGEKLRGPNNWPTDIPKFRTAVSLGVAPACFADTYRKTLAPAK